MVQMSWTFVNDSLCTTLCLQWEPEIIAIAVMYLAAKLSKFEVSRYKKYIAYIGGYYHETKYNFANTVSRNDYVISPGKRLGKSKRAWTWPVVGYVCGQSRDLRP